MIPKIIPDPRFWTAIQCDGGLCDQVLGFEVSMGDINCTTFLCPRCAEVLKEGK